MSQRSRRRAHLLFELLESRYNPSTPTLMTNINLPGANSAWDFSKAAFNPSPVVHDLFGDGQEEIITPGGDGNLYAYKYNKSNGTFQQLLQYYTGTFGAGVPIYSTPTVVNLPSGPAVFAGNAHGILFGFDARTGVILPGWPRSVVAPGEQPSSDPTIDGIFGSIAAGDLENNGNPDIVCSSFNHEITAFRPDGSVFWRFNNDDTVFSGVAIGDLNRDGRLEVVVGGDSAPSQFYWAGGKLDCLSWEGKREWVVQTDQVIWSTPVLADLQGNGTLDVVTGTGLFYRNGSSYTGNEVLAVDPNGNILPGWPFVTGPGSTTGNAPVQASPAVADLLGNGQLDVVFADFQGNLYAVAPNGQQIWKTAAFPGQGLYGAPIVGPDITGNGHADVFLGAVNGSPNNVVLQAFDGTTGNSIFSYPGFNGIAPLPQFNAAAVGHFTGDASYQMAIVANNYSSQGQLLSPSVLEILNLGNSNVAPPWGQLRQDGTADAVARSATFSANFITDLYQNALGRTPSAVELNNIQLPNFVRSPSLEPLVAGIIGSQESQTRQINSWYQLYLNRTSDAGGLNAYLNFLAAGHSYATAQTFIASSQEAFNDAGGTNPGYVTYLYQKILQRTPAQSEIDVWVNLLNSGALSRAQVASDFLLSAEHTNQLVDGYYAAFQPGGLSTPPADDLEAMGMDLRSGHLETQVLTQLLTANGDYVSMQQQGSWVRALYQDVLARAAGPTEVAAWLTLLEGGRSTTTVANAIVSSPEANKQVLTTPQFPAGPVRVGSIQGYYEHFLGRTPSAAEAAGWVNALNNGATRNTVIEAFTGSDEYYNLAGGTPTGFINKVFNDLLGRAPAASNIQQGLAQPNVRTALPIQILVGVPNEYFIDEVTMYFNAYLHRFPNTLADQTRLIASINPFGAQIFVDALNGGASPASIQLGILTSAEYQNVALYKEFWGGGGRWLT